MEILGMDRGWVGNGCGPNRRIGHGYDRSVDCDGIGSGCSQYPCLSTLCVKSCSVLICCLIWVGVPFPYIESF